MLFTFTIILGIALICFGVYIMHCIYKGHRVVTNNTSITHTSISHMAMPYGNLYFDQIVWVVQMIYIVFSLKETESEEIENGVTKF